MSGIDLEAMFQQAVSAAEDTGETIPGKKSTPPVQEKKPEVSKPKQEHKPVIEEEDEDPYGFETDLFDQEPVKEQKPEPKVEQKPVETPRREERKAPVAQVATQKPAREYSKPTDISVSSISKILEMHKVFNGYNETEKNFVMGYFQVESHEPAKVIYGALTADPRELAALDKIVEARNLGAADRAFYLMGLDNESIESIYEQVDLLTGELGETGKVNERNKIKVCRALERAISGMPDDVFSYIDKLQEFSKKAIG